MAAEAKHYAVLVRPVQTEKSVEQQLRGVYVFEIAPGANKLTVKEAVEKIWNVRVANVRTVATRGEQRRNRFGFYRTPDGRKAYVQLQAGYEIEVQ
jgi:large subunit ribosomal protein L23